MELLRIQQVKEGVDLDGVLLWKVDWLLKECEKNLSFESFSTLLSLVLCLCLDIGCEMNNSKLAVWVLAQLNGG